MLAAKEYQNFIQEHIISVKESYVPHFRSHSYILKLNNFNYIIDPNFSQVLYRSLGGEKNPQAIFTTHCHYDHILALNDWRNNHKNELFATRKIPFWAHQNSTLYENDSIANCSAMFNTNFTFERADELFSDESIILLEPEYLLRILSFQGHAKDLCWLMVYKVSVKWQSTLEKILEAQKGSEDKFPHLLNLAELKSSGIDQTIYLENEPLAVFGGDFIFDQAIGRCDLKYSSLLEMEKSLDKVYQLGILEKWSLDLPILPGHGEFTSWGEELTYNPYLTNRKYLSN